MTRYHNKSPLKMSILKVVKSKLPKRREKRKRIKRDWTLKKMLMILWKIC